MKHVSNIVRTIGAVAGLAVAVGGTVYGTTLLANKQIHDEVRTDPVCGTGQHTNHEAVIEHDVATPGNTVAPLCDTLTITNLDGRERLIAFGVHDKHEAYDGIEERLLGKGESFTVTLMKAGDFRFHDHDDDEVGATFTVTP